MDKRLSCPVCDSKDVQFFYRGRCRRRPKDKRRWTVEKCNACTHAYLNPQPTWNDLEEYYSAEYAPYEESHGANDENNEQTISQARQSGQFRHIPLPQGKRLLDVGCGSGWFLRIAKQLGAEVMGVEPSKFGVDRARAESLDVHWGTLESFLGSDASIAPFDIITASHVLEHLPRPVESLKAMGSLLSEDGFIWIAVPNASCAACTMLKDRWHSTDLPYHLMQFTPQSLAQAAEVAGLRVRRQYTYSLPKSVAGSVCQVLRHRWMIPQRISRRCKWITDWYAPWRAVRLDARGEGEAILVELDRGVSSGSV